MTDAEQPISDVTSTARMVAAYRAIESDRSDALFRDPLAQRLAGAQGRAMVGAQRTARSGWWMVARTKLIDDLLDLALADGCDRVVNLAAGLDTRPYRLDLPHDLPWVEVDHADLLADKQRMLTDQQPRCALTQHAADLTDPAARRAVLDEALSGASRAFVLSEGLLMYLTSDEVTELADDLSRPEIAWWTVDFANAKLIDRIAKRETETLRNAPPEFGPDDGVTFFENLDWTPLEIESVLTAAHRYRRLPWWMRIIARLPQPDPRHPGNTPWYAVVRFTRGNQRREV